MIVKVVFFLSLIACAFSNKVTVAQMKSALNYVNLMRQIVRPSASAMRMIGFNADLQNLAKEWAETCQLYPPEGFENIGGVATFTRGENASLQLALDTWHDRVQLYDYKNNTCARRGKCAPYLQMVYDKAFLMGCASHDCTKEQSDMKDHVDLWVCLFNSRHPQGTRPYKEGTPCSQCGDHYYCYNKLCVRER